METGAKVPSVEMLCKLADLYSVSTDYLLGREFHVQNPYGTRFLFDICGTKWLAFEMEL